ncbi:unnamed protein product [Adineta steineri]|uniref:Uncharacterized protein n=1 Tax=Adineta steineri TaxID=433720 RepID=A0A813PVQ5_9BILA|nr:unnamed protein product [Adineta steineri]CAF3838554.1 unnamed protein product [Adineta steineri]
MNPLHMHDIIETVKDALLLPLGIEGHSSGSDPITHKKMRAEQASSTPNNASSNQPASTASSNQSTSTASSNQSTSTTSSTSAQTDTPDDKSEQHSSKSRKTEK